MHITWVSYRVQKFGRKNRELEKNFEGQKKLTNPLKLSSLKRRWEDIIAYLGQIQCQDGALKISLEAPTALQMPLTCPL